MSKTIVENTWSLYLGAYMPGEQDSNSKARHITLLTGAHLTLMHPILLMLVHNQTIGRLPDLTLENTLIWQFLKKNSNLTLWVKVKNLIRPCLAVPVMTKEWRQALPKYVLVQTLFHVWSNWSTLVYIKHNKQSKDVLEYRCHREKKYWSKTHRH